MTRAALQAIALTAVLLALAGLAALIGGCP